MLQVLVEAKWSLVSQLRSHFFQSETGSSRQLSPLTFLLLIVSFQDMGIEVDDSSESIQEFQMILDELVGDESMEKVRGEYEKLIQVLVKSRENEKRLMSKCRELNAKIVSTTTKVADALKMRQEDETKMNFLKRVRLYIC